MALNLRWTILAMAGALALTSACSRRKLKSLLPKKAPPPELDVAKVAPPPSPAPEQARAAQPPKTKKKAVVIKHGWDIPTAKALPNMIQELKASPFDGVVFTGGEASRTFTGKSLDPGKIKAHLAGLRALPQGLGLQNFIILYVDAIEGGLSGPNVETMVRNVEQMAKLVGPTEVRGIAFDNEVYRGDPWTMPHACPGLERKACGQAAFSAGQKMMSAIIKHWPDVEFLTFFGPWLHDPRTYTWINQYAIQNDWSDPKDVSGDFLAGVFAATVGNNAHFIDGGELYGLRSQEDFRKTATWMRDVMVKESPFFPKELKKPYAEQVGVGFGIYDDRVHLFSSIPRLNPQSWGQTISAAMKEAELVWIYTERHDWWKQDGNNWPDTSKKGTEGPVSPAWIKAATQAIKAK